MNDYLPKWHRELEIFSKIKPIIILEGNVLDSYQYPVNGSIPKGSVLRIEEYLHYYFKDLGYQSIVFYDSLRGFYNNYENGYIESFAELVGTEVKEKHIYADFKGRNNTAPNIIRNVVTQSLISSVIIMNFASRYITSPDNMEQSEIDSFTMLIQASMEAKDVVNTKVGTLKNLIILIANKVNDMPAWFYLDNPNIKNILLTTPSKEEREQLVKSELFSSFFSKNIYDEEITYYEKYPEKLNKIQDKFIGITEGFSFTELNGLRKLSKRQKIHIHNFCDVVDLYKFGIKENPWNNIKHSEIKNAYNDFNRRVKGQEIAITKTLDVIKRAMTGMSGLQSSSNTRPKGVLFFAGPTGTGKTETAKTLAEKLFGDERSCIRFDMSEYGQSHSDQKLLGAPPGYVGYEAGGQLTNAVKNNPFSILLFDEIEKAHPSILDKFLQILEDGRMTDGQGNTVYFSETIIIFTSNLGIYGLDENGNRILRVTPDMSYEDVQSSVQKGIEEYFKLQLGRPEILNRIGENIVVFDFIRKDVAIEILKSQVNKIIDNLNYEKKIILSISDNAMNILVEKSLANLHNGGRGIGNIVESVLINPLSRYLFDNEIYENKTVIIEDINVETQPYFLNCKVL